MVDLSAKAAKYFGRYSEKWTEPQLTQGSKFQYVASLDGHFMLTLVSDPSDKDCVEKFVEAVRDDQTAGKARQHMSILASGRLGGDVFFLVFTWGMLCYQN